MKVLKVWYHIFIFLEKETRFFIDKIEPKSKQNVQSKE